MARVDQMPAPLSFSCVAGDPLPWTIVVAGARVSEPSLVILDGPDGTEVSGVTPTVLTNDGTDVVCALSGVDTLAIKALKPGAMPARATYCIRALVDDEGPFALAAGQIEVLAVGSTDNSGSTSASHTITLAEGRVITLVATLGATAGMTNLAWVASPTAGVISSDTGDDATLTLVDGTNAGLMAPAQHSKLAGIEAGATADMTAAEILTAVKTVDGASSGLDADMLDGQHASAFEAAGTAASAVAAHEAAADPHPTYTTAAELTSALAGKQPLYPTVATVSGTTDTLTAADHGTTIRYTNASLVTVTLPTDVSEDLSDGFWCSLVSEGAAGLTLSTSGLTLGGSSPNKSIAQNEVLVVMKTPAANTWLILGGTSA